MSKILAIAGNTLRESLRDRILYVILVFALVVIAISRALGWISVGQDQFFLQDFSLLAISVFGVIISVFVGTSMVYKEVDKRTLYTILSRPVDRWQFLVGKYLGLLGTVMLVGLLMEAFFVAYLLIQGYFPQGERRELLLWSLALIHVEYALVTALAIFFSMLSSPILSAVMTLTVWLSGLSSQELLNLANRMDQLQVEKGANLAFDATSRSVSFVYHLTPHFNYFAEVQRWAVWGMAEQDRLYFAAVDGLYRMGYGIGYVVVILAVSSLLFRRKSF